MRPSNYHTDRPKNILSKWQNRGTYTIDTREICFRGRDIVELDDESAIYVC